MKIPSLKNEYDDLEEEYDDLGTLGIKYKSLIKENDVLKIK